MADEDMARRAWKAMMDGMADEVARRGDVMPRLLITQVACGELAGLPYLIQTDVKPFSPDELVRLLRNLADSIERSAATDKALAKMEAEKN